MMEKLIQTEEMYNACWNIFKDKMNCSLHFNIAFIMVM